MILQAAVALVLDGYQQATPKNPMYQAAEVRKSADDLYHAIVVDDASKAREEAIKVAAVALRFLVDTGLSQQTLSYSRKEASNQERYPGEGEVSLPEPRQQK